VAMTNGSPPRAADRAAPASPGCGTAMSIADRGIRAEQLEPLSELERVECCNACSETTKEEDCVTVQKLYAVQNLYG
jgi:hypothetical protein